MKTGSSENDIQEVDELRPSLKLAAEGTVEIVAAIALLTALAFLIGGHLAVSASGRGGLLVHVDADDGDRLIAKTDAQPMEMRGREMSGWLLIPTESVRTKRHLATWVNRGAAHARSP